MKGTESLEPVDKRMTKFGRKVQQPCGAASLGSDRRSKIPTKKEERLEKLL